MQIPGRIVLVAPAGGAARPAARPPRAGVRPRRRGANPGQGVVAPGPGGAVLLRRRLLRASRRSRTTPRWSSSSTWTTSTTCSRAWSSRTSAAGRSPPSATARGTRSPRRSRPSRSTSPPTPPWPNSSARSAASRSTGDPDPLTGTILGVETRTRRSARTRSSPSTTSTCSPPRGSGVPLDRSARQLLDEHLDSELRKALAILSLGRDDKKKTVTLSFLGKGQRRVRVGYIQETPIWKTSYRLVLDERKRRSCRAGRSWRTPRRRTGRSVELTLVSGRPISYAMDLYQPLYARRPVVEPQLPAASVPRPTSGSSPRRWKTRSARR